MKRAWTSIATVGISTVFATFAAWSGQPAAAQDAQSATSEAAAPDTEDEIPHLGTGEFLWYPERSTSGPVVVLVSLKDQLAYIYRNGIEIGITNVSTGKPGHQTPTGVFKILEKQKVHYSSIYKGASMPNMQRLTWTGIAMHAGHLPGYPASHGCIRLPDEFSEKLFEVTDKGGTVVVSDGGFGIEDVGHPGLAIPVGVDLENVADAAGTAAIADSYWNPAASPEGPVGVVISAADQKAYVYRNGILIGRTPIEISNPSEPLPWGVSVMLEGNYDEPNPYLPGRKMPKWMAVHHPEGVAGAEFRHQIVDRLKVPPIFGVQAFSLFEPGTTVVFTNQPAGDETRTESDFTIMAHDEPEAVTAAKE